MAANFSFEFLEIGKREHFYETGCTTRVYVECIQYTYIFSVFPPYISEYCYQG